MHTHNDLKSPDMKETAQHQLNNVNDVLLTHALRAKIAASSGLAPTLPKCRQCQQQLR